MNINEFWEIIDRVHVESNGNMDSKSQLLKQVLLEQDEKDLIDFIHHFDVADAEAYTWPLWGAAYVMCGGCSDDSFSDFRATLISQGREVYERALADPESLAELEIDVEDIFYEGFQYVKNEVAKEKLGEIPETPINFPCDPSGSEWDEDTVEELYPVLAAKYSGEVVIEPPLGTNKPWWKFW